MSPFPSYLELKVLHFMWKLADPLRCEGEYWSLYRAPSVIISRDTLRLMVGRGWLERTHKFESEDHDDYRINAEGLHAAEGYEQEYLGMIEGSINWNVR